MPLKWDRSYILTYNIFVCEKEQKPLHNSFPILSVNFVEICQQRSKAKQNRTLLCDNQV